MPRRNFQVDAEGMVWHVFESGSEGDDEEGVDEGIEDMLRRMRAADGQLSPGRFALMGCHLVVVSPEDLRRWGRKQCMRALKRVFDAWTCAWLAARVVARLRRLAF